YFYGDYCSGRIWNGIQSGQTWSSTQLIDTALRITSFGEDEGGELYVVHHGFGSDGTLQRIVETSQSFPLTVARTGAGAGTVASAPAGIDCGSVCSRTFGAGAVLTLSATPAAGSVFTGWSGGGSGAGTCAVTLGGDTAVTAAFAFQGFVLSVSTVGQGSVSSNPAGIGCGATCAAAFVPGTTVTLTALTAAGATFSGWIGACAGTTAFCTVPMTAARSVNATFVTTFPGAFADDPLAAGATLVKA